MGGDDEDSAEDEDTPSGIFAPKSDLTKEVAQAGVVKSPSLKAVLMDRMMLCLQEYRHLPS